MTPLILPQTGRIAGFTGTRERLTAVQTTALGRVLDLFEPYQVQHGDCVGADEAVHYLCLTKSILICVRPPIDTKHRAWCSLVHPYVVSCEPKPYLQRNHDIVNNSTYLIACPKEAAEVLRSGTWATVRYAKKQGKVVYIIFPDGHVDRRPKVDVA
jgi:hypothetical protein